MVTQPIHVNRTGPCSTSKTYSRFFFKESCTLASEMIRFGIQSYTTVFYNDIDIFSKDRKAVRSHREKFLDGVTQIVREELEDYLI